MGAGQPGQNSKKIRATVKPDFQSNNASIPTVTTRLGDRISRSPIQDRLKNIGVSIEGGQVTLRGSVATEADKRLMERMMKLEPGVNSVRNELVVTGAPATANGTGSGIETVPAVRN